MATVFVSCKFPKPILHTSLELARRAAANNDVVAVYRVVGFLRKLRRLFDALNAFEKACVMLASGNVSPSLASYRTERFILERLLISSYLDSF